MAVLFAFSNITLETEARANEYNVIRLLGYRRRELLSSTVTEVLAVDVLAAIPGLPIGTVGGSLPFDYAARLQDVYGYSTTFDSAKVAVVFAIVVGSILLVVWPAYRHLTWIDTTDVNRRPSG